MILLPAGKAKNREDLNKQLGFEEEDRWPMVWIIFFSAVFVFGIAMAAILGVWAWMANG